jgi:alkylation response protein AidB-like acyl-CoA dehydrogenase
MTGDRDDDWDDDRDDDWDDDWTTMALDLTFSPEQEMLRETVRGVCAQYSPLPVVRQLENDATGYPAELWKQLGALDLLGLLIPEEHGGSGMSLIEAVVLYEELGRSLAPTPHLVSCVVAAGVLASGGSDEQRSTWLPQIASGDAIVSVAWLEPDGGFGPPGIRVWAETAGDGFTLHGTKRHVSFASAATRLLVLARTGDDEVALFLVDPNADGVTLTQQQSVSYDTQYRVDFDAVTVASADRVGTWAAWQPTMYDAAVLVAAQAVGGAEFAQEITVQYAKDREQFGKPLGAFQALAHNLADRQTELDGARELVHEAAWARSSGRDVARLAPMAKLFACRTFREVTATAQQIFGGNGFTVEYDIQLYFRRAKQLQLTWWDDRYLTDLIAADVLDS